jgi:pilus assembly protein Flp/PilA
MERILHRLKRFLAQEDGPTAVEYAVLLALIILVCFVAIQALGSAASTSFERVITEGGFGGGS